MDLPPDGHQIVAWARFAREIEAMALQGYVSSLRSQHAQLESQIATELHRPLPDQPTVTKLKREKLKVKERLSKLADEPSDHPPTLN